MDRSMKLAGAALAAAALVGVTMPAQADAKPAPTVKLQMQTSIPALAKCFPKAKATITVKLTTDKKGYDTVKIEAEGLRPRTDFTLFLLEKAGPPFGAAEYFGDFTTDRWGRAYNEYNLIAEEAFAFNNETGKRTDLNSFGFWFADERADNSCKGVPNVVTGFDGDGKAGIQMMNTGRNRLP